jgi:hypothetical protein
MENLESTPLACQGFNPDKYPKQNLWAFSPEGKFMQIFPQAHPGVEDKIGASKVQTTLELPIAGWPACP